MDRVFLSFELPLRPYTRGRKTEPFWETRTHMMHMTLCTHTHARTLVRGDEDVGEGHEADERVVADDLLRHVPVEELLLLGGFGGEFGGVVVCCY